MALKRLNGVRRSECYLGVSDAGRERGKGRNGAERTTETGGEADAGQDCSKTSQCSVGATGSKGS